MSEKAEDPGYVGWDRLFKAPSLYYGTGMASSAGSAPLVERRVGELETALRVVRLLLILDATGTRVIRDIVTAALGEEPWRSS